MDDEREQRASVAPLLAVAGVASGGLLVWSWLRNRTQLEHASTAPSEMRPAARGWQWPVPMWQDYSPVVSDGWGSGRSSLDGAPLVHRGVDVMYARKSLDDHAQALPRGTAGGSKWYFMPAGISALAAREGRVIYAARGPRGHAVTIRHADRWSTFYQHLASVRVRVGDHIAAGDVLGEIGGDPTQKPALRHLHFELRDPHGRAIDPKPHLLTWPRARALAIADGASATVLLPPPKAA